MVFAQRRKGAKKDAKGTPSLFAALRLCGKTLLAILLCIVSTFAARNCVRAIHVDANGSPTPVARVV